MPYNPKDPITFIPDNKNQLPPGDNKGTIKIPGNTPPEQHGTVQVPQDPSGPTLIFPDVPGMHT